MFEPKNVDSPAELAAAMATWPGFKATNPVPISIDGAEGLLVEVTSTKTFKQCPDGEAFVWKTELGTLIDTYPMVDADGLLRPAQFRIVDVDGHLVVVRLSDRTGKVSQSTRTRLCTRSTRSSSMPSWIDPPAIRNHRSGEPRSRR
jgi:hypothetical protein